MPFRGSVANFSASQAHFQLHLFFLVVIFLYASQSTLLRCQTACWEAERQWGLRFPCPRFLSMTTQRTSSLRVCQFSERVSQRLSTPLFQSFAAMAINFKVGLFVDFNSSAQVCIGAVCVCFLLCVLHEDILNLIPYPTELKRWVHGWQQRHLCLSKLSSIAYTSR